MSKLQLLYEKLLKIAFAFAGVFFVFFLIDLFAAIATGALNFNSAGSRFINPDYPFYRFTLLPLLIFIVIFLIAGRVFYYLAHKESDLLSVDDYKRKVREAEDGETQTFKREDLYEKLKRTRQRKPKDPNRPSLGVRIKDNASDAVEAVGAFFKNTYNKAKDGIDKQKEKMQNKRQLKQELAKIDEEQKAAEEKAARTRTKLNKTELILHVSKETGISQTNTRTFVNTLLDIIRETTVAGEEVSIAKFGRFEKIEYQDYIEVNTKTDEEFTVEAHKTIEFFPFKGFLDSMDGISEETVPEEVKEEPVVEEQVQEEVKEEPVVEEQVQEEVKEEPVVEETVQEEVKEEPVVEETVQEEVKEEPVVEETVQEEVKEEPVVETKPEEVVIPAVVPVVEEKTEEKVEAPKPKKPAKPKTVTKTKKEFIEMMDETTDLSKNKANKFLKFFAQTVKEALAERLDVELPGIGVFTTIEMPAKEAVNPQTGEKIVVPAHFQVRLRFDEDFKDKVNN